MKKRKPLTMRMWAHMNRNRSGRLRFVLYGVDEPLLIRRKKDVLEWIDDNRAKGDEAVRVTVTVEDKA
jgi:hypothetical protein